MTTTQKSFWSLVVVLSVMGGLAWFGLTPFGKTLVEQITSIGSPSGSTFGTAKFAGIAVNLSAPGANATSSSILNGDSSDRYVSSIKVGCESVGTSKVAYSGGGLSALYVAAATSSTANAATTTASNLVGGGVTNIGTSTANYAVSTSTISTGSPAPYVIWASGSYMTFTTNATNTAVCTFGVDYFGA